jgi:hypothetical protein
MAFDGLLLVWNFSSHFPRLCPGPPLSASFFIRKHQLKQFPASEEAPLLTTKGGMAVRYHGHKRMTYDLDIYLFSMDNADWRGDDLDWWECEFDSVFRKAGWSQVRDPWQNEDLYMNYSSSWAHPEYKIHVDVVTTELNEKKTGELVYSSENIPYLSLPTLLQLKLLSYGKRTERFAACAKAKDLDDILQLIKTNGLDSNLCDSWDSKIQALYKKFFENPRCGLLPNRRDRKLITTYLIAKNLRDADILKDIYNYHYLKDLPKFEEDEDSEEDNEVQEWQRQYLRERSRGSGVLETDTGGWTWDRAS